METLCTFSADLDRHMSQLDEDERWGLMVDKCIADLMRSGGENDPFSANNLREALEESDIDLVCKSLAERNIAAAGAEILKITYGYWRDIAEAEAKRIVGNEFDDRFVGCGPW